MSAVGVVAAEDSALATDGLASELVVQSGHSVQDHSLAIAEIGHIFKLCMAATATAHR